MKNLFIYILIILILYASYQYYMLYFNNNNNFLSFLFNKFTNKTNNNSTNNICSLKKNNSNNINCDNGICSIKKPFNLNDLDDLDELNNLDNINLNENINNLDNIDLNENINKLDYNINNLDFNIDTEELTLTENTKNIVDNVLNKNTLVYLDIMINNKYIGKIIIELFDNIVPKTTYNFKQLCLTKYKGSLFHRIIKGFCIQGGDYMNQDGLFSNSIYGEKFDDENFILKHDNKYLLSMANSGPNTNGSQFFFTLNKLDHLDDKHVVFGKVLEESYDIIEKLGNIMTDKNDKPIYECKIVDCGLYNN